MATRKRFTGGARAATGATDLPAGGTSLTVGSGELGTWSALASAGAPFNVIVNRGLADEEHMTGTGITGDSITGLTRGLDTTGDQSHAAPFTVVHGLFASDEDEANALAALANAKGDIIAATAADTWARLAVGADNAVLVADSTATEGVAYKATLAGLTLTTPTIADFTNAQHDHWDANDGGGLVVTDFTNMQHGHLDADDGGTLTVAAIPDLSGAWTAYTPAWLGVTTNPALGNGTIAGRYKLIGKLLHVYVEIVAGTTTTFGSGAWLIGLPAGLSAAGVPSAQLGQTAHGLLFDQSANTVRRALGYVAASGSQFRFYAGDAVDVTTGAVQSTVPFTWATADVLTFTAIIETT